MPDFDLLDRLQEIARAVARDEVMPRFQRVSAGKKQDGSLFTEADLACQQALARLLPELAPCPVLGEEMSAAEQQALWDKHDDGLWVVDPIDGTTNFVHGLPYFAVSIALMRHGRSTLGVVYVPVLDECYAAAAGHGAWLNGRSLRQVDVNPCLGDAVAVVEPKYLGGHLPARVVSTAPFGSLRNYGASTIDWCFLAAGRFDLLLHGAQRLWDYAAGALIAAEAGCVLGTLHGDDYWHDAIWARSAVAARSDVLYAGWQSWVQQNR
ncbi:myo-inositol-1(or 4)-monophosphatase [Andreprevotia lacus DSM 23236]|jgi:myo-inositol-1(or 4)-monophosphatase|uniref:Myo-inositol-1(Or 4)-monophosphatase n=1 Tax=Andreprevotia lacus DSM 23236 TaxID=1121001 RepID=A0A1W1Y0S2_9NEIS|nr:inositol monophosphatase family protein [Andreprevotia lacus]SMC29737.1 myo-inositol-1(or 4)-monophosphatase [Andreprevotia lacus DSM 23236]